MVCSFSQLRNKEVVNVKTGEKIGYIDDIEIDTGTGKVSAFIIFGRARAFGLIGRDEDIVIRFSDIELVGEDTVLVDTKEGAVCIKTRSITAENLLK
ncbi:MAG: YlmC/YmxH family sporulation protein [Ruminococcus sp.]|nr:YlmC/YmxH family sporulation protein [Ruminococcus sp.]